MCRDLLNAVRAHISGVSAGRHALAQQKSAQRGLKSVACSIPSSLHVASFTPDDVANSERQSPVSQGTPRVYGSHAIAQRATPRAHSSSE